MYEKGISLAFVARFRMYLGIKLTCKSSVKKFLLFCEEIQDGNHHRFSISWMQWKSQDAFFSGTIQRFLKVLLVLFKARLFYRLYLLMFSITTFISLIIFNMIFNILYLLIWISEVLMYLILVFTFSFFCYFYFWYLVFLHVGMCLIFIFTRIVSVRKLWGLH